MKQSVLAVLGVLVVNVLVVNAWGEQEVTVKGRFTCCKRSGGGQGTQSSEEQVRPPKGQEQQSQEQQGPWVPPEQQQQQQQQQKAPTQQQQQKKVPPKTQTQRKVPPKEQNQEQVQQSQQQQQLREWQKPMQLNEQAMQRLAEQGLIVGPKLVSAEDSVQRKSVPKERRRRSAAAAGRCIPEAQTGVSIKLWEKDTFDSDDQLGEATTDGRGNFQVSGGEFEVGSIEPYLVITHDCEEAANQKLEPGCNFVTKVPVPKKHINGAPLVINSFDDFLATNSDASTVQSC